MEWMWSALFLSQKGTDDEHAPCEVRPQVQHVSQLLSHRAAMRELSHRVRSGRQGAGEDAGTALAPTLVQDESKSSDLEDGAEQRRLTHNGHTIRITIGAATSGSAFKYTMSETTDIGAVWPHASWDIYGDPKFGNSPPIDISMEDTVIFQGASGNQHLQNHPFAVINHGYTFEEADAWPDYTSS
jgi:hypothetical protein